MVWEAQDNGKTGELERVKEIEPPVFLHCSVCKDSNKFYPITIAKHKFETPKIPVAKETFRI